MKETHSNYGFGGWGSSWNTSSGINGENTGITDITDTTKNTSIEESGIWSYGQGSNSKKKTASPGFDFGVFSATNEAQEESAALEDTKGEGNDDWSETVPPAGKKDKKSKKKGAQGFEDTLKDFESIATGDSKPEPEAVGGDTLGDTVWGAPVTKVTKKKSKKAEAVPKTSEISPVAPHAITAPIAPAEEEGPALGSKKEKKKKQKASSGEAEDFKELAIEEALDPEIGAETNRGFSAKKEKKDKKGISEETVSHEEPAVTEELAAEETSWGVDTKKDPKKTKKSPQDKPYGADPASAIKNGSKKSKKSAWEEGKEGEAPQVFAAPESEQLEIPVLGFGSKEGSKKKSKKGVSDESDKAVNSFLAFEDEQELEPEPEHIWGSGTKKDSKKKTKKGVSEESDKVANPLSAFENEPEPKVEHSWGFETAKKDNKKKSKKGVVEKPDEENPMVSPLAKPESEPGYDWGFGNSNNKTKEEVTLKEPGHAEDSMMFSGYKPELQLNFGWGMETNKDNKMKSKKGAFEGFDNGEDTVPQVFPNAELDVATKWGFTGAKTSKKKGKTGVAEETKHADDLSPIDVPEQTSAVGEMAGTWGMLAKDRKSKKGHFEVKETPMRAAETVQIIDHPNGFANDSWPDWGGDKKKEKKGRKGSAADAKKEEPSLMPLSPQPQDSEPPASSFDLWGGLKKEKEKEKKGKKGKPVGSGPELEPEPELEPITNMTFDTQADDAYTDGNGYGSWGLSAKDKTKEEKDMEKVTEWDQAKDHHEMYEQAIKGKVDKEEEKEKVKPGKKGKSTNSTLSKTKNLMANSTPDPIAAIEPGNWGTWDGLKKDKKLVGRKDMFQGAPPRAPTPPAQGLTPEPTPSPIPELDDIGEADWGSSFAPMKAKGKKDAKKPTKAEEPKSDKKAAKDKAVEPTAEPTKNKTKNDAKKGAAKEETPAKVARSFWGSMGMTATPKSKAIEEEKTDDDEEDSADKDEGNYDEEIEGEETNDLIDFEMGGDSITDLIDASVSQGSKAKADGGKLGKVSSKESDKSNKISDKKKKGNFMTEVAGVAVVVPEFKETNETNETNWTSTTPQKDDIWGFWGSTSKKPSGKKTEQADDPKKEITKQSWTNPIASLNQFSNQPESSFFDDQPEPPKTTKPPKTAIMSTVKPSTKSTVAQRVKALEKERLEKEKEKEKEKQKTLVPISDPDPDPSPDLFEPLSKFDSPPKKVNPVAKSKVTPAAKGAASKKKDPFPPSFEEIVENKQAFQDPVPGSFPTEGADDNITDVIPPPPVAKKTNKKTPKPKKEPKTNLMDFDDMPITSPPVPDLPEVPDVPDVPEAPPTPPPEPVAAKPAKKERARVRDEGISSWGFWGAPPRKPVKKEAKAKDDGDVPTTAAKERAPGAGLVRSKSTKTAKEKETEKVSAKSSGSDKDRKAESRPAKSRGSSFGGFFGGPPPPRARPLRRQSVATSKITSRRQSVDAEATGLPSPPAEVVPEMNSKAAKLMGTSGGKLARKESTRGPPKTSGIQSRRAKTDPTENANRRHLVVPDPYPIDDDDMVMVGGLDYPTVSDPSPKSKGVRKDKGTDSKAKKEVKSIPPSQPGFTRSKRSPSKKQVSGEWGKADVLPNLEQVKPAPEPADDIVMVEAGPSSDGAELPSLQEALAFAEPPSAPAPPQRPSTSARKSDNKLMGLFGLRKTRRAPETYERPGSKAFVDDDVNLRRKRTVGGGNDATKRVRRDDRKVRRPERPDIDADGFVTDAPLERDATEYVEAKNDERRSKHASRSRPATEYRESKARDDEDQRAKLRESDQAQDDIRRTKTKESRDRRTRREEEEAAIRKEEKRAKKAAREERATKDEPLSRDLDPSSAFEGHSKHRDRDARDRDLPPETSSRPRKSGHRRSHIDTPKSPDATERRPRRDERRSSRRTPGEKSSSHRKPTAAPVDDYFDPRNGAAGDIPDPVLDPTPLDSAPHESTAPNPVPLDPGPLDPQEPYMHSGANEHTSSWVKSQISQPPPPPPLEPSVLESAPVLGGAGDESSVDEEARRALRRKSKRQSRYASGGDGGDGGGERRRRRESRRETVRSSEGSAEQERERTYARRKTDYGGGVPLRGYGTTGGGLGGKRESWFQKIKGLADVR